MAYTNPNQTADYTQTTVLAGTAAAPVVIANTDTYGADVYAMTLTDTTAAATLSYVLVTSGGRINVTNTTVTSASVTKGGTLNINGGNNVVDLQAGDPDAVVLVNWTSGTITGGNTNIAKLYIYNTTGYRFGANAKIVDGLATGFEFGANAIAGRTYNFGSGITMKDATITTNVNVGILNGARMEGGTFNTGTVQLLGGAVVSGATVNKGAKLYLGSGTDAVNIKAYGITVNSGGVLSAATNNTAAEYNIVISGATVKSGGTLQGGNRVVYQDCVVSAGATMTMTNMGILAGHKTVIEEGATTPGQLGTNFHVVDGVISGMNLTKVGSYYQFSISDIDIVDGVIGTSGSLYMTGDGNITLENITVTDNGSINWTKDNNTLKGSNTNIRQGGITRFGANAAVVNGVGTDFNFTTTSKYNFGDGIALNAPRIAIQAAGEVNILSGAVIRDAALSGGQLKLASGAVASGGTVTGGAMTVANGGLVSGATLDGGTFLLENGGTMSGGTINVNNSASVIVSGGVYDTTVNGAIQIANNAYVRNLQAADGNVFFNATGATIAGAETNMGKIYHWNTTGYRFGENAKIVNGVGTGFQIGIFGPNNIYNFGDGITIEDAEITSSVIGILEGAKFTGANITRGTVRVSGGLASGGAITGGTMVAYQDGTVRGVAMNGGEVIASQGGLVSGGRLSADALFVRGGEARGVEVESLGKLHVSNGGVANGIVFVASGGSMILSAGATANDVEVQKWTTVSANSMRDYLEIQAGATVNNLRASARVYISGGGQINNLVVSGDNNNIASAMTSNVTIIGGHTEGSPASLIASNGTVLSNFEFRTGGYLIASQGALVSGAAFDGTSYTVRGATVREATQYKGTMNVSAGLVEELLISGGTINVSNGTFKDATMSSGGTVNANGGKIENITLKGDKTTVAIYDGGLVSNATLIGDTEAAQSVNNARLLMYGGTLSGATVKDNAFLSLSAGVADDIIVSDGGRVTFSHGVTINRATLEGGAATAAINAKGGVINGIEQTGGTLTVQELNISGAVLGRGTANDVHATGGRVIVASGGKLVNAQIIGDATFKFEKDGAGATIAGAKTTIDDMSYGDTALTATVKNGVVTGFTPGTEFKLSIGDDILVKDVEFNNGNIRISCFDGAKVDGALVKAGAIVCNAGATGTLNNVTLEGTGVLNISGTAKAENTVVKGGKLAINDTGHAENTTLYLGGRIDLTAGADTGNNLTLAFDGTEGAMNVDLSKVTASTTLYATGVETVGTYTLGTGSRDGVTQKWGLYENALVNGGTWDDALNEVTYSFDGTALTTTALEIKTGAAAGLAGDNYTALRTNDRAAKWTDAAAAATLVTENFSGDAYLTVAGNAAAAIYGAGVNYAGTVNIDAKSGTIRNLAAGAEAGKTVGSVKLTFDGATLDGAGYAGGFGSVTGKTETLIETGSFTKDFYAGALANYAKTSTATTVGDISLTINGGTFSGNIYGASAVKANAAGAHTAGDVTLSITDGSTTKGGQACIFAGGYATGSAADTTVYTVGNINAEISGGSWGTAAGGRGLFGGAFASGVTAEAQNVTITISGGTFGNVYGGGWAQKTNGKSIVGDVNISIEGGTIANVFGGGSHSTSGGTTETGDITITVSGGNITGDIYARGQLDGDTTGAANVIFTGAADFSCGVFGYSYVGSETGDAALSFSGYTGEFAGALGGFNGITLDGSTAMTLSTESGSVSNGAWEFDLTDRASALAGTSLLTWSTADFANDTIKVSFADDTQAQGGWNIAAVAEAFNDTSFDVEIGGAEIVSGLAYKEQIASGDYQGWGFTLDEGVLKFKQLA